MGLGLYRLTPQMFSRSGKFRRPERSLSTIRVIWIGIQ